MIGDEALSAGVGGYAAGLAGERRGTKMSELGAVACMRWAPCVFASGQEQGRLLSTGP